MSNYTKFVSLSLTALILFGGLTLSAEAAKKIVVPGGQNQIKGVDQGKVGVWLFNGTSKVKVYSVNYPEAGPKGEKPGAGMKWIAIELEVKNARKFTGSYGGVNCKLQLVDKDDQLFERIFHINRADWTKRESPRRLLPAAGLKALYVGALPSDFVPVRMIYFVEPGVPVYRINF